MLSKKMNTTRNMFGKRSGFIHQSGLTYSNVLNEAMNRRFMFLNDSLQFYASFKQIHHLLILWNIRPYLKRHLHRHDGFSIGAPLDRGIEPCNLDGVTDSIARAALNPSRVSFGRAPTRPKRFLAPAAVIRRAVNRQMAIPTE
jgi:hypothetical protein